ncbi:hypothetical protein [Phascolarctobacterium sp.]|nr:hypothetical protein [Phascolarctobacterium sp.]
MLDLDPFYEILIVKNRKNKKDKVIARITNDEKEVIKGYTIKFIW